MHPVRSFSRDEKLSLRNDHCSVQESVVSSRYYLLSVGFSAALWVSPLRMLFVSVEPPAFDHEAKATNGDPTAPF